MVLVIPTCRKRCDKWGTQRILALMDKKEIESPKLTARFLIWITGFLIVLFALIAHFVWRVF